MSDESVHAALRSAARLVIVEAPAGCGKTHQGAQFASDHVGSSTDRVLILTHTHAACSVFADRTKNALSRSEVRTIDSLIGQIASVYHKGLDLPADVATWARRTEHGHAQLAIRVASLLKRYPMVAHSVAQRYQVVICDEHQDSSGDQHAIVESLLDYGTRVRIFADPMQAIFPDRSVAGAAPACEWPNLLSKADAFEPLDSPHRWKSGCKELGEWTLKARETLKTGGQIDLRQGRPKSVDVVIADNQAQRNLEYSLSGQSRRPLDTFANQNTSLLILTRYNDTARSLRSFFNRRIPLWEGQTRPSLEQLVDKVQGSAGDARVLASAIVDFMGSVGKGFSPSAFGDTLLQEVRDACVARRTGKPAVIQELAKLLIREPDHRGVSKLLRRLHELAASHAQFDDIKLDCLREFCDAVRLGDFDTVEAAMTGITNRRIYSRPQPPARAISTIHKAKGLECESVLVLPCDAKTFPNRFDARCLLYVALSRAKSRLMFVVPQSAPSPLLIV